MPLPTLDFTLPSIHDGTILECRIQFPTRSVGNGDGQRSDRGKTNQRGAILAHPYAPLGGCYDDPVLASITKEFLRAGFVVGTFNFRGAGGSKGRTSWTAKPEVLDYMSFVGFFIHYLHHLSSRASESVVFKAVARNGHEDHDDDLNEILLVLGGYSYGSLITTFLPTSHVILARFAAARVGHVEAEILGRALQLGRQTKDTGQRSSLDASSTSDSPVHTVLMEGEATEPESSPRLSRSYRRSLEHVRASISKGKADRRRPSSREAINGAERACSRDVAWPLVRTHYLLISPLLPPISALATFFTHLRPVPDGAGREEEEEEKLSRWPSMAIYGDRDLFTSPRKLRAWATRLAARSYSTFRCCEITDAGHFWREEASETRLRRAVRQWANQVRSKTLQASDEPSS